MRFPVSSAPFLAPSTSVQSIMSQLILALVPGIAASAWQFGLGVFIHMSLALAVALLAEAAILKLRRRPLWTSLSDCSAAITAILLAISLPPLVPWWITVFGSLFAIIFGKQLYGGLGYNPFNPAMVGYVALLVSFPRQMTAWLPPVELSHVQLSFAQIASLIFHGSQLFDGLSQATPLDTFKTQLNLQTHMDEIQSAAIFGGFSGKGWYWVNFGYLLGGLWLWRRSVIDWRISSAFLASLYLIAMFFFLYDPAIYPNPLFHWFSGATMLGAFFIATDPVTASTTPRGRWIYGGLIGMLVYVIRSWGSYPDGVAFSVLFVNFSAPTIDYYTRPRTYGHPR
jgi:electron transport complex protein RnfD